MAQIAQTTTTTDFTGTLLRREHKIGQKSVRLVFREHDKNVLCITTNLRTVTLPVGQEYHVQGEFRYRGKQTFIYEPRITVLRQRLRPAYRFVIGFAVFACLASLSTVVYIRQHNPAKPPMTPVRAVITK